MTEREIMLAVDPNGRISEIELQPTNSKEDFVLVDDEVERLMARLSKQEKLDERYRDYRAELRVKD